MGGVSITNNSTKWERRERSWGSTTMWVSSGSEIPEQREAPKNRLLISKISKGLQNKALSLLLHGFRVNENTSKRKGGKRGTYPMVEKRSK